MRDVEDVGRKLQEWIRERERRKVGQKGRMEICQGEEKQEEEGGREDKSMEDKSVEDIQSQEEGGRVGASHRGRNGKKH